MQNKADILARLQNDILSLQGFKPASTAVETDFGLGRIIQSFPNSIFPFASLHEFVCNSKEECAASSAFVSGLLSSVLDKGGVAVWVGTKRQVFPPALKAFGISPEQVLFIELKKEKDALWVAEEALKCTTITTVVGEISDLDFSGSRRLQLAIEKTGVGCFLLRHNPRNFTTASTSRWNIRPLLSKTQSDMPGITFPRWQVDLLKVRNGKPGSWVVEWVDVRFRHPSKLVAITGGGLQSKTG